MLRKILVIDDSKTLRKYASMALALEWPDVEVEEFNPLKRDKPGPDFPWKDYDVLLLDYQLGLKKETGLDWLAEFTLNPELPITIILTGEGSERVAVQAMKLGANDYVIKDNRSFGQVIATIKKTIEFRTRTELATQISDEDDSYPHPAVLSTEEVTRAKVGNWPVRTDRCDTTVTLSPKELNAIRTLRVKRVCKRIRKKSGTISLPPGYKFIEELGTKSLSTVMLTEREEDDKPVVLKVLSTIEAGDDPALFKRFIQEYTLIAHVSHPHIVRIYEQNFSLEHAYIAMEYFPKGDIYNRITQGLSCSKAVRYLREIAYGLRAVHEMGIVHRDLKASNILFRRDGSLAITDFGIAKVLSGRHSLTLEGVVIGTPNYMSPEQITGEEADTRSDLYSLGIIFYQMLTGQLPFHADDVIGLLYAHVHRDPPPLTGLLIDYQPIIDRLLAKQPDDRFDDIDTMLEALGELNV